MIDFRLSDWLERTVSVLMSLLPRDDRRMLLLAVVFKTLLDYGFIWRLSKIDNYIFSPSITTIFISTAIVALLSLTLPSVERISGIAARILFAFYVIPVLSYWGFATSNVSNWFTLLLIVGFVLVNIIPQVGQILMTEYSKSSGVEQFFDGTTTFFGSKSNSVVVSILWVVTSVLIGGTIVSNGLPPVGKLLSEGTLAVRDIFTLPHPVFYSSVLV